MLDSGSRNYLELMKKALSASLYEESAWKVSTPNSIFKKLVHWVLSARSLMLVKRRPFDPAAREGGRDWPMFGFTMVGLRRLTNIEQCIASVVAEQVAGDFVECGVWRGGSSIFARAVLNAYGAEDRKVWLADSFEGMPARTTKDMADPELIGTTYLESSLEDVKSNFQKFDLLGDNVEFIKGWFSDTLSKSNIESISILRLDGDYYSSTIDALNGLYEKVSIGGYIIIDDYNAFESCKQAIADFCSAREIMPNIKPIDDVSVFWRREASQ